MDRKICFEHAGIPVEIIPSDFDEESIDIQDPQKLVQTLAMNKAKVVAEKWKKNRQVSEGFAVVIGADTMVEFQGQLIGKAATAAEAFKIIKRLAGQTHRIMTGVAIIRTDSGQVHTFVDSASVHFQPLTDSEIHAYLTITDEYKGRAGAYSLQDRASLFIDRIEGSPTNVIGIPMARLREEIKNLGIDLLDPSKGF